MAASNVGAVPISKLPSSETQELHLQLLQSLASLPSSSQLSRQFTYDIPFRSSSSRVTKKTPTKLHSETSTACLRHLMKASSPTFASETI